MYMRIIVYKCMYLYKSRGRKTGGEKEVLMTSPKEEGEGAAPPPSVHQRREPNHLVKQRID